MKKTLIFLACLALFPSLKAQKLYAYIFCATHDPIIGEGAKVNLQRMKRIMSDITEKTRIEVEAKYFDGSAQKPINVESISKEIKNIENQNYNEKDIILFYYSGHGTNSNSPNIYPNFMINGAATSLNLKKTHDKFIQTKAHLVITLADCCNYNGKEVKSAGKVGSSKDEPKKVAKDPDITKNYGALFEKTKTNLIACSSTKNQLSIYNKDFGGFFTSSFDISLFQTLNREENEKKVTWYSVMTKTREMTMATAQEFGKEQLPIFAFDVEPDFELEVEHSGKVIDFDDETAPNPNKDKPKPNKKSKKKGNKENNSGNEQPNIEPNENQQPTLLTKNKEIKSEEKALNDSLKQKELAEMFWVECIKGQTFQRLAELNSVEISDLLEWNQYRLNDDEIEQEQILHGGWLIFYKKKDFWTNNFFLLLFLSTFFVQFGIVLYLYKQVFLPKKQNTKQSILLFECSEKPTLRRILSSGSMHHVYGVIQGVDC